MDTFFNKEKPRGVVRATGEDAQDYLQSQLTINLKPLPVEGVRFGLRLNSKGKVMAGAYVMKLGEEEFLLLSRGADSSHLIDLLEENVVADDVSFANETEKWNLHSIWGEGIERAIKDLGLEMPVSGKWVNGLTGHAFLDPRLPQDTVSILMRKEQDKEPFLWPSGFRLSEESKLEVLRIGAGLVSIPDEIGPGELPQEGGLDLDYVDFDKGCYLGQEVMARLHAMGKTRRRTCPVRWTGSESLVTPTDLFAGEKKVGTLKSLVREKRDGVGIALVHELGLPFLKEEGLVPMNATSGRIEPL
jgi:hypothetical protein